MSEIAFRIDRSIEPNLFASELSSRLADRNLNRMFPSVSVLIINYSATKHALQMEEFPLALDHDMFAQASVGGGSCRIQ